MEWGLLFPEWPKWIIMQSCILLHSITVGVVDITIIIIIMTTYLLIGQVFTPTQE